jgi:uncharacterized protein YqjF (DUF2071 family)
MTSQREGEAVRYASERKGNTAAFHGRYGPEGPVFAATTGSLDHWLTERYCLYVPNRQGVLHRGDILHTPWPLQPAWADIAVITYRTSRLTFRHQAQASLLQTPRRNQVANTGVDNTG